MKYNLFCINTEYHFLLSLSIIYDKFSDGSYFNKLILLESSSGRLARIPDTSDFDFLSIERIKEEDDNVKGKLDQLLQNSYEYFFHFYEFNILNAYLVKKLNRNCRKVYCEDGTAIYQKYDVLALGSRFRQTVKDYKKAFKLGLFHFGILPHRLVHGQSGYIDELWLTQPELYLSVYNTNKKVRKINLLTEKGAIDFTKSFFPKPKAEIPFSDILFFLGRVSYSEMYLKEEIALFQTIMDRAPGKECFIKVHPLTPPEQVNAYAKLQGLKIITESLPAEILLANLKDSLIIGVDSTALFFENKNCKSFVLYKYLQAKDVYPKYRTIPFPGHVIEYTGKEI